MSLPQGVRAFADGFGAARTPGVARYVWLPALVSLVVIVAGLVFAFGWLESLSTWLMGLLPDWLGFLGVIVTPLLYLLGVLAGVWLFGFLAVLIASPFLGDLSIAVERSRFASGPEQTPGFWTGLAGAFGRELRKLGYHLPRLVIVFVLTLVPVVNLAAPLLWLVFGAWTLAVQFCDYPAENRGRPFRETVELLQRHRAAALGFGACATFTLAIPLLNFLMIPVAVAGGTLLWRRLTEADV
ncbi:MAG TPA: sulfate transporter CysZ [Pseudomonadales bacterium]